ncbi:exodeoxyribonuclease 7 small subunit [Paenibacillus faecis]|uniref:exodeoxyribonuclease VII small subunit n=1 Tax=Paenibacillus TaxID=44249 RepID=UPI001B243A47|nr:MULTISPECIES: exodeoxyribonuclease VII small subunit [Paenibacillus]MCA1295878.1 exodeoxyribonuclease VII small subunit [Paenibacillus sp. alder61]GIO83649.1 exodeoxyribonuclease 7 small subunit [Paenibacillus faecis]
MAKETQEREQEQEQELNFEEAMNRLEDIVSQLERGDVPLEQAIELFQNGMRLSQLCGQKLSQVERKIEMIVDQEGEIGKKPFQPQIEESDALG